MRSRPSSTSSITRDELEELDPKKTRAIEIQDFVDLDDIDPIYFDHPYYLGPDKGAEKAYGLLVKAMEDSRKVAIARFVLRNKENLAALRPMDGVMTMATMRFADEVVTPDEIADSIEGDPGKPTKKELEMAKALIDSLAGEFDADEYRDEYREEVLALIERKAKGESVVAAKSEAPTPTKAPDLMAALEESLAAVKGEDLAKGDDGATKRAPARSKSKPKSASKSKSRRADREARPRQASRGRRARDRAHQPRQGALAGSARRPGRRRPARLHQGARARLLRPNRGDDPPSPPRPAADPGPLPRRGRVTTLLREARPLAHPGLGADGADRDGDRRGARLHRL